jgi:hypothetical protein
MIVASSNPPMYLLREVSEIEDLDDRQQKIYHKFQVVWKLFAFGSEQEMNAARKQAITIMHESQDIIPHKNTKDRSSTDPSKQADISNQRRVKFAEGTKRLFV